jgi:uncharacterized membrane protein YfcA
MDIFTAAALVVIGIAAGLIASIVGGATVIVYPGLIAVGMLPHPAVIANLVSLMPGTLLAALSDRSQLPKFNRDFVQLIVASIVGAAAGALLLLVTPEHTFNVIIPLLLGFATLLLAFAERIGNWLRARAAHRGREISFDVTSLKFLLPVSVYGGYFGAGVGVLILGVMMLATGGDYRSANVAKNFLSSLNGLAAAVVFTVQGAVPWPETLMMMIGTIGGGLLGAYLARMIPRGVMHVIVVAMGAILTAYFVWRYWL